MHSYRNKEMKTGNGFLVELGHITLTVGGGGGTIFSDSFVFLRAGQPIGKGEFYVLAAFDYQ